MSNANSKLNLVAKGLLIGLALPFVAVRELSMTKALNVLMRKVVKV